MREHNKREHATDTIEKKMRVKDKNKISKGRAEHSNLDEVKTWECKQAELRAIETKKQEPHSLSPFFDCPLQFCHKMKKRKKWMKDCLERTMDNSTVTRSAKINVVWPWTDLFTNCLSVRIVGPHHPMWINTLLKEKWSNGHDDWFERIWRICYDDDEESNQHIKNYQERWNN